LGKTPANTPSITTTTLTALTWNVRGLTRVATEMDAMIKEHNPDLVFMTEPKQTERLHGKAYVKECAPGYILRYSSIPHPNAGEYRTRSDATVSDRAGSAVIVALADRHAHSDPIVTIPTSKDTRGHLQLSMVTPMGNGSQPLLLGGVYMPCQDTRQQDAVLEQLRTTLTTPETTLAIISGDWNIVDLADKRLAAFIDSNNLTKISIVDANGDIRVDPITHTVRRPRHAPRIGPHPNSPAPPQRPIVELHNESDSAWRSVRSYPVANKSDH
jgi:exonuclease III